MADSGIDYKNELRGLNRDRSISEYKVNIYRENLISNLPSKDEIIRIDDIKKVKKSFFKRLFSLFN